MIWRDLSTALFIALGAACVAPRPAPPVESPPPRPELWVDASWAPGGDGSRQSPLKQLPAALPAGGLVHLSSGVYTGAWELAAGVELRGVGEVVLSRPGKGAVLQLTNATLSHLWVQGGEQGVLVHGQASLDGVHFTGFSQVGAQVEAGARFSCRACTFDGTIPGALGVQAVDADVDLTDARFSGGLRDAVRATRGAVRLASTSSLGSGTLLRSLGAHARVSRCQAQAGVGPALFAAGGTLEVDALEVVGHEYALLGHDVTVKVDGLVSKGSVGGVALQQAQGTLVHVRVGRAGAMGALQLLDSDVAVDELDVEGALGVAVLVRAGAARLTKVRVRDVTREGGTEADPQLGDGLQLRGVRAWVDDVRVQDVDGSALVVTHFAIVTGGAVVSERSGAAAVTVDRVASLELQALTVHGAHGPGVLVMDQAHAKVGQLQVSGVEEPVWADCEASAWAELGQVGQALLPSRCVRVTGLPPRDAPR